MIINEIEPSIYQVWIAAIAAFGTAIGIIVNIIIKKHEGNKAIRIEEIKANEGNLQSTITEQSEHIAELKKDIAQIRIETETNKALLVDMRKKYYAVAVSYRILLKDLGGKFENDKNSMGLLELFDKILYENKIE